MAKHKYSPEQIIHKLREAEILLSKGLTAQQVARKIGVCGDVWLFRFGYASHFEPHPSKRGYSHGGRYIIRGQVTLSVSLSVYSQSPLSLLPVYSESTFSWIVVRKPEVASKTVIFVSELGFSGC